MSLFPTSERKINKKSFPVSIYQPVSLVDAKNFIDNLYSDPDISLGDESLYGDPFGEFVYNFLENYKGLDPDSDTEGDMEVLDIDDNGKVTGQYVIQFEDGSDMRIHFKGFIGYDGDGFNILVIIKLNLLTGSIEPILLPIFR